MQVSVSEAKGLLTDLVRRAEAGEEVVLTRHGHPVAQITARKVQLSPSEMRKRRRALLEAARGSGKDRIGPDAARATDFLYDDFGLPA